MKKTLTINLNGSVFHIDEDAYQRLNGYLNAIDKHFPNMEDKEIVRDIEARIAELFSEKLINRNVVEIADVEQVISILGQPNQFGGENETADEQPKNEQSEKTQNSRKSSRKLYRDPDNQVLGGVLAGLAAYLNFDVVWLRILAVVLVVFGIGSPILLYIIAWIIMPEAKTSAQKLEMRGEAVNIDSIKNFFESEQLHENARKVGSRVREIVPILAKIIFIFAGVIAAIVGFSVIVALLAAAVALFFTGSWLIFDAGMISSTIFWSAVAALVLIPAVGIFIGGIRLIKNRQNPQNMQRCSGVFGWSMLALWIISLLVLIASAIYGTNNGGINNIGDIGNIIENKFEYKINEKVGNQITESRNISTFNAVEIGNGMEVEFIDSDSLFVDITASKNSIDNVQCEVKDSVLYIKRKLQKYNFFRRGEFIRVKIGTDKIKNITANNACKIYSDTPLKAENFVLDVENACKINLDVEAKNVKIKCENACKLDMKINAQNISIACENAVKGNFEVNTDFLDINAENACKISVEGVTKQLTKSKGNASKIDVDNLKVIN